MGIKKRSFFLLTVMPKHSVMSKSSQLLPFGSFQSKWYSNCARGSSMLGSANDMPGHILLPAPNGIYSKCVPLKSIGLSKNLSGLKFSASFQYLESLPMAHALTMTLLFASISYPLITQFSSHSLGTRRGAAGCNLKVSLTIDLKNFNS
ncbi:hypothetical protein QQP08_012974 [Theobroma cacao]|nr:hypothetical protein QQP08_012974 [Theobroma cacao]